jgi:SRSO17 transposase
LAIEKKNGILLTKTSQEREQQKEPQVNEIDEGDVFDPQRWGLPVEAVQELAERLRRTWERDSDCFKTKTCDTSENAYVYLRGKLTMETQRNYANIARRVLGIENDGQSLQHFMSDSGWPAEAVFEQIQAEIGEQAELRGGMLTLDESGKKCSGDQKAGAGRQWLGSEGKVDLGQVGVAAGYYQAGYWALVDAELFLPEAWFDEGQAKLRKRYHIPSERTFKTKPELGLALIQRAQANGLPFEVVGCDSLYGRNRQLRADLDGANIHYMADIPADTQVYLEKPAVGVPETPPGKKGPPFTQKHVLSDAGPVEVRALVDHPDWEFQSVADRHAERGLLSYPCTARRVWTLTEAMDVREEWLFIRCEPDDTFSFSLSNAPTQTPLAQLALWRCQRYFAERIFQDAKTETGWDELMARKYRAWIHHTALDALALWFVTQTKLDWARQHPRDPELVFQLELEMLPTLSVANVRELLRAVLPLDQLSPDDATRLVVKHLVNRSHSTRSRLNQQRRRRRAPT